MVDALVDTYYTPYTGYHHAIADGDLCCAVPEPIPPASSPPLEIGEPFEVF